MKTLKDKWRRTEKERKEGRDAEAREEKDGEEKLISRRSGCYCDLVKFKHHGVAQNIRNVRS